MPTAIACRNGLVRHRCHGKPANRAMAQPASCEPPADRVQRVHCLRGLAIVLVVLGHVIGRLDSAGVLGQVGPWSRIYAWIYAFHMPAFFFAAGLFATASLRGGLGPFVREKFSTLLYTYLLWTVLLWLFHVAVGSFTDYRSDPWALAKMLYAPAASTWFLYILLAMLLLFGLLSRVGLGRWGLLPVAGLAHPLDTLLRAALRLQHRPELEVLLIGGGQGRRAVETFLAEHRPTNVRLLPYQPLSQLSHSLSAADMHHGEYGPGDGGDRASLQGLWGHGRRPASSPAGPP